MEYPQQGQQVQVQQPQQVPQGENPFANERYKDIQVPDSPIQYGGNIADSLLNDIEVPEDIRHEYWNIFHKDNVLTFLDENRKNSKLLNFDIMKIDLLNSIPYYDYTFEKEKELNILRNVYETKLDRALGFKGGNVKNERIALVSQFSEQRQISEHSGAPMMKDTFFKRLLGRR